MIDPEIERQYAECTELVTAWKTYLDYFNQTVVKKVDLTPEMEHQFMDVKGRIAMLHDAFLEAVKNDRIIAQNMLAIVNRSITLHHLRKISVADARKIEIEWHESYLLLNETVSQLAEKREELEGVNEFQHNMKRRMTRIKVGFLNIFTSGWFKGLAAVVIIVGVLWGIPTFNVFGIETWDVLRNKQYIGGPYSAMRDILRDGLGIPGPYSTVQKFVSSKLPPEIGELYRAGEVIEDNRKINKEAFSSFFTFIPAAPELDNNNGSNYLMGAKDYKLMEVDWDGLNQKPIIGTFYWYDIGPAEKFALAHNTRVNEMKNSNELNLPQNQLIGQRLVISDHNVLLIIVHPEEDTRNRVRNDVLKLP